MYLGRLHLGERWLSSQAPAKAPAEWPEGKDQLPGFLPMTIAWMMAIKGRLRRK
jgi:hypothetical protein